MSRAGARFRRALWSVAWALAGGLRVVGERPVGPVIVAANHSSHADTAALLAAIPARSRPVFAAAADYWFGSPVKRFMAGSIVACLPVSRGQDGAYAALLDAARPVLADGGIVVVYPEGTRSTDGVLGEFRSGAVRLARDAGVPLVPVGLRGTGQVLPKNGRFSATGGEVRFGTAMPAGGLDGADGSWLRDQVQGLLAEDLPPAPSSRVWRVVSERVRTPLLFWLMAAWGVAEALSWPIIAEMALVLFAVAVPRRVLPAAVALAPGSAGGAVLHAWLVSRGVDVPLPLTTSRMTETAAEHLQGGASGVWHQLANGIPIKVYAAEAGGSALDLLTFAVAVTAERATRILAVGAVLTVAARLLHPLLRRHYGWYLMLVSVAFVLGLGQVLRTWA